MRHAAPGASFVQVCCAISPVSLSLSLSPLSGERITDTHTEPPLLLSYYNYATTHKVGFAMANGGGSVHTLDRVFNVCINF